MSPTGKSKKEFYNKKARFEYELLDTYEAGVALTSEEIKAIRAGRVDLTGSYAKLVSGEIWWLGGMINVQEGDRQRSRKLLLHKQEIAHLAGKVSEKGLALVPLKLYLHRGRAKIEIALGRGLKKYDKRQKIKEREESREISRRIKQ